MSKLALLPIADGVTVPQAALYEKEAARYIKINIHGFRSLVNDGLIPYRTHIGMTRRIFLCSDLDRYLSKLEKSSQRKILPEGFANAHRTTEGKHDER